MLDDGKPIVPPNRLALRFMDCLGVGLLALGWLLGLALGLCFGSVGFGLGGLALAWVGLLWLALGLALAWCWVLAWCWALGVALPWVGCWVLGVGGVGCLGWVVLGCGVWLWLQPLGGGSRFCVLLCKPR